MVKIIATSDLHGELPDIPQCDLLLICGDICPDGSPSRQARWLDNHFRQWLEKIPAQEIIGIAGNHDLIFEQAEHLVPKELNWHYLEDSHIELLGFKIYGTPWQLPFWGAFNLDETELQQKYRHVPQDIDIFISHAPPFGIFDKVPGNNNLAYHTGSIALRDKIFEIKPKLFVCGHIHCDVGIWQTRETLFANVSLLNDQMEVANSPSVFEIMRKTKAGRSDKIELD